MSLQQAIEKYYEDHGTASTLLGDVIAESDGDIFRACERKLGESNASDEMGQWAKDGAVGFHIRRELTKYLEKHYPECFGLEEQDTGRFPPEHDLYNDAIDQIGKDRKAGL